MPKKQRLTSRNTQVRSHFAALEKRYPQWKLEALLDATANKFFISSRTVQAILNHEPAYKD